jgi:UDP-GlcNAc:undecaprenyl-phosphate/decaprenyl-phosphate GlcNAc-1-phosphate transferase
MLLFSVFALALAVTMALIPPLMGYAARLSLVDMPNERKVHSGVVPRVGGVAMVIGAIVPLLLWRPLEHDLMGLLAALLVLLVFGAWDDSKDLDYRLKFLGQFAAAVIAVLFGGVKLSMLPFMGLDPVSDLIAVPLTIVFLVGATNAINLTDGLDGLAAGVALLSSCAIALLAYLADGPDIILFCFAIAGVIFGFLRFNTFPARVFMGDTGSQFLGFVLGALAIIVTQRPNSALNPLLPLFLLGLPVVDTATVMARRIKQKRSPFAPDKSHIHHQLLGLGLAHYEAVATIYVVQMLFVGCAILLRFETDLLVSVVYAGLFAAVSVAIVLAGKRDWQSRRMGITRLISAVDSSSHARNLPTNLLRCGISLYLAAACAVAKDIPSDLKFGALFLFLVLGARLIWADRLRFLPLRLLVFPAIAFAVYIVNYNARAAALVPLDLRIAVFAAVVILMLVAIRYAKKEAFETTPTDLLVIALAGGVGVMYQHDILDDQLAPLVIELVVLFYAGELIMRQMESSWNCFTGGMLAVLLLIGGRLFL